MRHTYCARDEEIELRPLQKGDLELLRIWRNDRQLSLYLRDIPYISTQSQETWYERYLEDDHTIFFAVVDLEKHAVIGSVAIYGFFGNFSEIGKIVIGDPSARGKGLGYKSLLLAMLVGFQYLSIEIFHLDVHEDNIPAKSIYSKAGYYKTGAHAFAGGGTEIEMEITKKEFLRQNPSYRNVKIYKMEETLWEQ